MVIKVAFYKAEGDWINRIVRWWTKSRYSHAELIMPDGLTWIGISPFKGSLLRAKEKRYFRDMDEEEQNDIQHNERLNVFILRRIGIDDMCNLFRRVNRQKPLNAQEHRQARITPFSEFVRSIANQEIITDPEKPTEKQAAGLFLNFVFSNSDNIDKRSHEEMVAQLCLKRDRDGDLKKKELDKYYEEKHAILHFRISVIEGGQQQQWDGRFF